MRFYNGELFQIVTTYDRDKVKGMKEADLVDAISLTYGTATSLLSRFLITPTMARLHWYSARWEDTDYSHDLIRTGDRSSFALVLSNKRLNALAQAAIAEAVRLDAIEAPQKQINLQKLQDETIASTLRGLDPRTGQTFVREQRELPTRWPSIGGGSRLVAPGTLVPPEWQVEHDSDASWSRG